MKSFSVLTVTRREGWFQLAAKSIQRQTVRPEEWVIIAEPEVNDLASKYGAFPIIVDSAPVKTQLSNLNASLNKGLRHIRSDYVIFYQDFIELPKDCFKKLMELSDERTFVTTCTPNYDGSDDGRYTGVNTARRCRPEEWETNVAAAPMDFLRALGGFDERLDAGWSWDNVNLAQRAAMLGAKFICDESNRPKLLPHDMETHKTLPPNGELCAKIIGSMRAGLEPIQLNHL